MNVITLEKNAKRVYSNINANVKKTSFSSCFFTHLFLRLSNLVILNEHTSVGINLIDLKISRKYFQQFLAKKKKLLLGCIDKLLENLIMVKYLMLFSHCKWLLSSFIRKKLFNECLFSKNGDKKDLI
jgi:hypothetical protein